MLTPSGWGYTTENMALECGFEANMVLGCALCYIGLLAATSCYISHIALATVLYLSNFAWADQREKVYFIFYKALLRCKECFINLSTMLYET